MNVIIRDGAHRHLPLMQLIPDNGCNKYLNRSQSFSSNLMIYLISNCPEMQIVDYRCMKNEIGQKIVILAPCVNCPLLFDDSRY